MVTGTGCRGNTGVLCGNPAGYPGEKLLCLVTGRIVGVIHKGRKIWLILTPMSAILENYYAKLKRVRFFWPWADPSPLRTSFIDGP